MDDDLQSLRRAVAVAPDDLRARWRLDQALSRIGKGWHEEDMPPGLTLDAERRGVYLRRSGRMRPIEMVYVGNVANNTPFYIARFHVTRRDYGLFCEATRRDYPPPADFDEAARSAQEQLEFHPVVNVTIEDARAYCEWLGCSVPTIRQWEIAAYGGDSHMGPCSRCNSTGEITEMRWESIGGGLAQLAAQVVCPDCEGARGRRPLHPWGSAAITDERAVTPRHTRYGYWLHSTAAVGAFDGKGRIVEARPLGASWCYAFDLLGNAAHLVEGRGVGQPDATAVSAIGGSFGSGESAERNPRRSNHIGFRPVLNV